ncbi:ABC-type transport auxiliary lipoprotein family protein [Oceanimonas sp. CHS3-5]|uniref:ABC-type transport auxiliary lipoprotein family protein n=1 Tax=Oceanimonas sp. CHS3-5 TaxID=3068186 RepID=UPI00273FC29C|nr:ABC-type transport auxiliary lipoprotein family protein [Oceanimonas sp. CHS3-5]MDP5293175.1 ABC-type transport auxiliary lipoprotein family protein [Oceanimonas sp. CHS3-5]
MSKGLVLLALLLGLAGCSVLPPAQPVSIYRLPPATLMSNDDGEQLGGLRLARPLATGVLNGNRLLVLTGQQSYQAYGDARWAAPLPQLWQDWLLDALWRNERLGGLSREDEGIRAEWELTGTLRAFEVDLSSGRREAVIQYEARLLRTTDRRLLASRRFEQREPLERLNADAVVTALGRAADRLVVEMSDWLLSQAQPQ